MENGKWTNPPACSSQKGVDRKLKSNLEWPHNANELDGSRSFMHGYFVQNSKCLSYKSVHIWSRVFIVAFLFILIKSVQYIIHLHMRTTVYAKFCASHLEGHFLGVLVSKCR